MSYERSPRLSKTHATNAGTAKPTLSVPLLLGVVLTVPAVAAFLNDPQIRDFGLSFHASGRAWIETGQPYGSEGLLNLNPPSVTGLVFVPAALLPVRVAAVVWTAAGALALASTWIWVSRRLSLTRTQSCNALGVLLCTMGAAGLVWLQGQMTWLLFPLGALGWNAHREGRAMETGAWLGVLIAAKPFLALAALPLGLMTCVTAAAVSLGISSASMPFTGLEPWQNWFASRESITWIANPGNASLWGLLARWSGIGLREPVTMSAMAPVIPVVVSVVGMSALFWTARQSDLDSRWTLAILTALLCSPLGWSHYLPLVGPPLIALKVRRQWTPLHWFAVGIWCLPPFLVYSPMAAGGRISGMVGSLYGMALLALWLGVALRSRRDTPTAPVGLAH